MRQFIADKYIVFLSICFCLAIFVYYQNRERRDSFGPEPSTDVDGSYGMFSAKTKFRACLNDIAQTFGNSIKRFYQEFALCIEAHVPIDENKMDVAFNGLSGEKKVYLPLSPRFPQDQCKWLTIGIGGNTKAEKIFKKRYPGCSFYGVDPGEIADFATIGKVFPYGVGKIHDFVHFC